MRPTLPAPLVQAVDLVGRAFAAAGETHAVVAACKELLVEARRRWQQEEGEYCDDITAVVVDLRSHYARLASAAPAETPSTARVLKDAGS